MTFYKVVKLRKDDIKMFFDIYYFILVIPAALFAMYAQFLVTSTFDKYKKHYSNQGKTGAMVARQILDSNGLQNVMIERAQGKLGDHFDPRTNVVRLSSDVHDGISVAAIGVAAHEVGHAIQHNHGYLPINIRNAILPVANIGSMLGIPLIFLGFLLEATGLVNVGLIVFAMVSVFQLVTLPVEFNASSRAIKTLEQDHYLYGEELTGAKRVLQAAALTYVAALVASLAQLLRLWLLYGGKGKK